MNIIQAIEDKNLFRIYLAGSDDGSLDSWASWLVFLKCLYGLPLTKADHEIAHRCTGRDPSRLSKDGYQETLVLTGRRGGKSKLIALVGAAEAVLSGKEKRLSTGEIGMISILSPTRLQSRIIFSYLKSVFHSTSLLANEVVEETKDGFVLRNGLEVHIMTGSPQSGGRGFSNVAVIVDECCFFGISEDSVRSDLELIRSLRPSLSSTGGRLLAVSTPFSAQGWAYATFRRCFANDDADTLVWNASSLQMNPLLSPSVVERAPPRR